MTTAILSTEIFDNVQRVIESVYKIIPAMDSDFEWDGFYELVKITLIYIVPTILPMLHICNVPVILLLIVYNMCHGVIRICQQHFCQKTTFIVLNFASIFQVAQSIRKGMVCSGAGRESLLGGLCKPSQ